MHDPSPPVVLVTVLDWGLGHAARCLPLLRLLQRNGCRLIVGSAGPALELLRRECPDLTLLPMPAYRVRYPFSSMALNMVLQGPRLLLTLWREWRWTRRIAGRYRPELILSDSRFGCFHARTPSVFLSHQLRPIAPSPVVRLYRWWLLNRFTERWVPAGPPPGNLAGRLADPEGMQPVFFTGNLSRFGNKSDEPVPEHSLAVLALLSGPEPQRSRLEKELLDELRSAPGECMLVRGLPGAPDYRQPGLSVRGAAFGEELRTLMLRARRIICRSGYSTLLDLAALGRQARLIPTPGQTEQEYLARRWQGRPLPHHPIDEGLILHRIEQLIRRKWRKRVN